MTPFLFALQFLTTLPIKIHQELTAKDFRQSQFFFPITGLILGIILTLVYYILSVLLFLPAIITSILLVGLLTLLTGGLHLDGLADTCDGIFSNKAKGEMLKIMRDSHIGTMGTLGLVLIISLKIILISQVLPGKIFPALVLMGVISRYVLVLVMHIFPYVRQQGKASLFMNNLSARVLIFTTLLTLFLVLIIFPAKGLIIFTSVIFLSWLIVRKISHELGGITGDVLGAICEIAEIGVLLFMI